MRFLKVVTSGLAVVLSVVAGLVATAIIAVAGVFIVLLARFLGRKPRRSAPSGAMRHVPAPRAAAGDVIDITATELRSEPPTR